MRISFCPQRRDDHVTASVSGDVLTVNGEQFDFSSLPDGASIDAADVPCDLVIGSIARTGGEIGVTLILPHGPMPSHDVAFPEPVVATNGPVDLPGHDGGGYVGA
ncbi:hypothetical protein [Oricola thermophila]|uniref:Uncharacterized protein n=1 Tax=Oricola thermophila TaxID=2742145 RepID=A0A6N1VH58_9HYPH|nr:hypothetical protein [Oricola thermophila]QKV20230.1 hypothetical protein HTY61_18125 [Oricola thermophila]